MNFSSSIKSKIVFFFILLFVYVTLFEFILPINKILPKPSLLYESFIHIWSDYNLLQALAITSTAVYLSIFFAFLLLYGVSRFIIKIGIEFSGSIETLKLFKFFPAIFFAIVFVFWFGDIFIAEILFGFLALFFLFIAELINASRNVQPEYIQSAKNLGLSINQIYSQVIWKAALPELTKKIIKSHYYIWTLLIIYEFISPINGFGGVYKLALSYNDFTALFTFAIIISIIVWIGDFILRRLTNKIVFWER